MSCEPGCEPVPDDSFVDLDELVVTVIGVVERVDRGSASAVYAGAA